MCVCDRLFIRLKYSLIITMCNNVFYIFSVIFKLMLDYRLVKKSWFGSLTSNGSSAEKDDSIISITMTNRSLNAVKAELIRAFLMVNFC